jgi:hypothetical protein
LKLEDTCEMEIIVEKTGREKLETTIPGTDYDRSKTTGE